jgi:hypothetical protein
MTGSRPAFCPRCGAARQANTSTCESCGHEYGYTIVPKQSPAGWSYKGPANQPIGDEPPGCLERSLIIGIVLFVAIEAVAVFLLVLRLIGA